VTRRPRPQPVDVHPAGTGDDAALAAAGSSGTTAEMPALTPSLVPSFGVLSWGISRTEFENAGAAMVFANADDLLVHIEENPIARLATRHRVAVSFLCIVLDRAYPPIGVSNLAAVMVEQAQNGATNELCQPPRRDSTTALQRR
jgi:hypothetical protein